MQCQRRTDTIFGNPSVGRRELEQRQRLHRERLKSTTSSIDTRPPAPRPHLTACGRDYVMRKKAMTEAAFSDLKMIQTIADTMSRSSDLPQRRGPVSLNADARKQEIHKVMHENLRLLNNLDNLEPTMSTRDLLREYEWRQRYMINASHSKRLTGEYTPDIQKIRSEDKLRHDTTKKALQTRMSNLQKSASTSYSTSMPLLPPPLYPTDSSAHKGTSVKGTAMRSLSRSAIQKPSALSALRHPPTKSSSSRLPAWADRGPSGLRSTKPESPSSTGYKVSHDAEEQSLGNRPCERNDADQTEDATTDTKCHAWNPSSIQKPIAPSLQDIDNAKDPHDVLDEQDVLQTPASGKSIPHMNTISGSYPSGSNGECKDSEACMPLKPESRMEITGSSLPQECLLNDGHQSVVNSSQPGADRIHSSRAADSQSNASSGSGHNITAPIPGKPVSSKSFNLCEDDAVSKARATPAHAEMSSSSETFEEQSIKDETSAGKRPTKDAPHELEHTPSQGVGRGAFQEGGFDDDTAPAMEPKDASHEFKAAPFQMEGREKSQERGFEHEAATETWPAEDAADEFEQEPSPNAGRGTFQEGDFEDEVADTRLMKDAADELEQERLDTPEGETFEEASDDEDEATRQQQPVKDESHHKTWETSAESAKSCEAPPAELSLSHECHDVIETAEGHEELLALQSRTTDDTTTLKEKGISIAPSAIVDFEVAVSTASINDVYAFAAKQSVQGGETLPNHQEHHASGSIVATQALPTGSPSNDEPRETLGVESCTSKEDDQVKGNDAREEDCEAERAHTKEKLGNQMEAPPWPAPAPKPTQKVDSGEKPQSLMKSIPPPLIIDINTNDDRDVTASPAKNSLGRSPHYTAQDTTHASESHLLSNKQAEKLSPSDAQTYHDGEKQEAAPQSLVSAASPGGNHVKELPSPPTEHQGNASGSLAGSAYSRPSSAGSDDKQPKQHLPQSTSGSSAGASEIGQVPASASSNEDAHVQSRSQSGTPTAAHETPSSNSGNDEDYDEYEEDRDEDGDADDNSKSNGGRGGGSGGIGGSGGTPGSNSGYDEDYDEYEEDRDEDGDADDNSNDNAGRGGGSGDHGGSSGNSGSGGSGTGGHAGGGKGDAAEEPDDAYDDDDDDDDDDDYEDEDAYDDDFSEEKSEDGGDEDEDGEYNEDDEGDEDDEDDADEEDDV